jgi:hypothetical protein
MTPDYLAALFSTNHGVKDAGGGGVKLGVTKGETPCNYGVPPPPAIGSLKSESPYFWGQK